MYHTNIFDHAKYIKEYMDSGIDVLSHEEVFKSQKLEDHFRAITIKAEKGYRLGSFKLVPFDVHHDCKCFGFLVSHPDSGDILFLTDTFMCEYTFDNLSHILIECNYSDEILEANILRGSLPAVMRPRLMMTHMELKNCCNTIMSNDITNIQNIILIHLSNGNSNEEQFVAKVKETTGKCNVFAGDKNMTIELNEEPF